MRYFDTGGRSPSQTLASWFAVVVQDGVTELRLQTGFFSIDSIGILMPSLEQCRKADRPTKALIGSNDASTLKGDVIQLVDALGIPRNRAQLGIISFGGAFFHPKTYHIMRPDGSQAAFVGSANLTASGLSLHVEAGIALDTREGDAPKLLSQIAAAIDGWFKEQREGMTVITDLQTVDTLVKNGVLAIAHPPRVTTQTSNGSSGQKAPRPRLKRLFSLPKVKGVSAAPENVYETEDGLLEANLNATDEVGHAVESVQLSGTSHTGKYKAFLMTLQKTDVGVGQITKGTSRRSPEIFVPLAARDANVEFWGWPDQFKADPKNKRKMDRFGVKMRIGTSIVDVNMMTWPAKHDFRLRSEQLRSAGNIGDILYLELSDGKSGFAYYVEVIPQGSARYGQYLARCGNVVRNSPKKWGYV